MRTLQNQYILFDFEAARACGNMVAEHRTVYTDSTHTCQRLRSQRIKIKLWQRLSELKESLCLFQQKIRPRPQHSIWVQYLAASEHRVVTSWSSPPHHPKWGHTKFRFGQSAAVSQDGLKESCKNRVVHVGTPLRAGAPPPHIFLKMRKAPLFMNFLEKDSPCLAADKAAVARDRKGGGSRQQRKNRKAVSFFSRIVYFCLRNTTTKPLVNKYCSLFGTEKWHQAWRTDI